MVWRADQKSGREAAIHSGLALALGSHPCVAVFLLASISIVRQVLFSVKRKASILENKNAKSRGLGGGGPIKKVTSSFLLCAGTSRLASDNRAPGADAGGCRNGSSSPMPGTVRDRWRSRRDRSARTSKSAISV